MHGRAARHRLALRHISRTRIKCFARSETLCWFYMRIDKPIILLVDDSTTDATLMQAACKKAGFPPSLQIARDGVEAIAFLAGEDCYADRNQFPLPTVVLLDLNMPRKNGFEVLAWVRKHTALKRLPIFILSASTRTVDV